MTNQVNEVLEAIREVCDLKRLEFGCLIDWGAWGSGVKGSTTTIRPYRWFDKGDNEEELSPKEMARTVKNCGAKIIGLPVHLEHLLWALDLNSTDPTTTISVSCNLMRIEMQGKFEIYNLQKSVEQNLNDNPDLTKWLHKLVNKK